jgi:hypothetical protein
VGPRVEYQVLSVRYQGLLPTFTTWARQEVQDPVAQGGVQTQGPELSDELGGHYGVEGCAVVH